MSSSPSVTTQPGEYAMSATRAEWAWTLYMQAPVSRSHTHSSPSCGREEAVSGEI